MRHYLGRAQCWCYLCSTEHRFHEPCAYPVSRPGDPPDLCRRCGSDIAQSPLPFARRKDYCTEECRMEAKRERRMALVGR